MMIHAKRIPAGPPLARAEPEPTCVWRQHTTTVTGGAEDTTDARRDQFRWNHRRQSSADAWASSSAGGEGCHIAGTRVGCHRERQDHCVCVSVLAHRARCGSHSPSSAGSTLETLKVETRARESALLAGVIEPLIRVRGSDVNVSVVVGLANVLLYVGRRRHVGVVVVAVVALQRLLYKFHL